MLTPVALVILIIQRAGVFGYDDSDNSAFGSKTAYDWVRNRTAFSNGQDMEMTFEDHYCRVMHVNLVARHGYRLPGAGEVTDIRALLDKVQGHNAADDVGSLEVNVPKEDEGQLNSLGKREMEELGTRTFTRFHDLLKDGTMAEMEFISTTMRRVKESAEHFKMAIADSLQASKSTSTHANYTSTPIYTNLKSTPIYTNDTLLRIYSSCPRYKAAMAETERCQLTDLYERSSANIREVQSHVTRKLGLKRGVELTPNDVKRAWQLCALQRVQNGVQSAEGTIWCSLVGNQQREYLELQNDLESYRKDSYGNDIAKDINCVLLQKLFQAMDDAKRGYLHNTTYSVGTFMFGHTGTLLGALTALGLFRDISPSPDRQFRIDKIAPMSGNLGFGLFFCPNRPIRGVSGSGVSESDSESDGRFAVKLFFNERETNKPNRTESAVYGYDEFRKMYAHVMQCNAQEVCKLSAETGTSGGWGRVNSVLTIWTSAVILFLIK